MTEVEAHERAGLLLAELRRLDDMSAIEHLAQALVNVEALCNFKIQGLLLNIEELRAALQRAHAEP